MRLRGMGNIVGGFLVLIAVAFLAWFVFNELRIAAWSAMVNVAQQGRFMEAMVSQRLELVDWLLEPTNTTGAYRVWLDMLNTGHEPVRVMYAEVRVEACRPVIPAGNTTLCRALASEDWADANAAGLAYNGSLRVWSEDGDTVVMPGEHLYIET